MVKPVSAPNRHGAVRHARILAFSLALLAASYFGHAVVDPEPVFACYCTRAATIAETVATNEVTVIAGTIGAALADRTAIGVDTWFHGVEPASVVWVRGGRNTFTSCDEFIGGGERWLLVLWGGATAPGANGLYSTSMCERNGRIGTAEGDAALAEANELFANAAASPSAPHAPPSMIELSRWVGPGLVWVMIVGLVALAMFAAIWVVARRRSTG